MYGQFVFHPWQWVVGWGFKTRPRLLWCLKAKRAEGAEFPVAMMFDPARGEGAAEYLSSFLRMLSCKEAV